MAIEQELSELRDAVKELTAALHNVVMPVAVGTPAEEKPAPAKATRGRAKKTEPKKAEPVTTEDDDLDLGGTEPASDDLDLGLDDPKPAKDIDPKELKQLLGQVMAKKGRESILDMFKKFGGKNFDDLKSSDYPAIWKQAEALIA